MNSEETEFQINPKYETVGECKIIIDINESHVLEILSKILHEEFGRSNIYVKKLKVGDYKIISPDGKIEYVIERKSVDDLVASLTDKRLEVQVPELLDIGLYDQNRSFFVIIGDPYDLSLWDHTNFESIDSVTRLLTGTTLKENASGNNLPQFILPNHRQLAIQIDYIAKFLEDDKRVRIKDLRVRKNILNTNAKSDLIANTRLSQLASIDKCGVKRAKAILEHFNWNYKKIQNATPKELDKVKNIGSVLAKRIDAVYNDEPGWEELDMDTLLDMKQQIENLINNKEYEKEYKEKHKK